MATEEIQTFTKGTSMTGRPPLINLQDVLAKLRHGFANGKTDNEILKNLPFNKWATLHSYLSRNGISLVKLRKEHDV